MNAALQFDRFAIQAPTRQLLVDGTPVPLGARAFDLLIALVERRDRVVSKHELLELVWPGLVVEENNLQVQVSALRKLLGPQAIATVPGRGYRFTLPMNSASSSAASPAPATPARDPVTPAPTNVGVQAPALIGRDHDLATLGTLVAEHRLLTIVGAGGIGKTRLAQALAIQQRDRWPDGVWFVELAGTAEPGHVAAAIAAALDRPLGGAASPPTELAERLAPLDALIVLDNCEHVIDAVTDVVTRLLAGSARLRIVATSQELLKVVGEHVYRLDALAVPAAGGTEDIAGYGAVALFVERARALVPRFTVTAANAASIADICRRLDGLPLAIELAAARVPVLGVDGLRKHLDQRFRVLTGGARMALRKHQTLQAALDWSHDLLTPDERVVFRRLGVFAGGFTLELAQAVAADERIDAWTVLELLANLVDKSLVVAGGDDDGAMPRYSLLETTRAFALQQLAGAGEIEPLLRRHAHALAEQLAPLSRIRWSTVETRKLTRAAVLEISNVRAALDWALGESGDRLLGIDLLVAARPLWRVSGQVVEGLERMERQLPVPPEAGLRREAELYLGIVLLANDTHWRADRYFEQAQHVETLFRRLGDRDGLLSVLCMLAFWAGARGDPRIAERALDEARSLTGPEAPYPVRATLERIRADQCLWQGDLDGALAAYQRAGDINRAANDVFWVHAAQGHRAIVLNAAGRFDEAVASLEQVVAHWRRSGDLRFMGTSLVALAQARAALGDEGDAPLVLAHEGYRHLRLTGPTGAALFAAALHHARRGDLHRAVLLVGRVRAQRAAFGLSVPPVLLRPETELLERVSPPLGVACREALLQTGGAMTEGEAAACAFEGAALDEVAACAPG